MFVSSYSTYLTASHIRPEKTEKKGEGFTLKKESKPVTAPREETEERRLPVDYIAPFKILRNQQRVREQVKQSQQTQQTQKNKFTKVSLLKNAQTAYQEGSVKFAFIKKPKIPLAQPHKKIPPNSTAKLNALNTYIANENYYKITA